jgi:hypothetical protein
MGWLRFLAPTSKRRYKALIVALVGVAVGSFMATAVAQNDGKPKTFDELIAENAERMMEEGRQAFRDDTFGSEAFWGDQLMLHRTIAGRRHGGVGPGLSPRMALALGLKIDAEALPSNLVAAVRAGRVDLDDPAVTLQLLELNAVVGVTGFFGSNGRLRSIGIHCALCHSTVDQSFSSREIPPGAIGARLDGWPARDLNVGAIIASAPTVKPFADLLGVDEAAVREVLLSWGPGKFDAELILDGKAFRPDGKSAATLNPAAFGLAGVNLHTYTGWGGVAHWNAFVSNLEMQGKGTFWDPRLDDAEQFPIAAKAGFGNKRSDPDLITSKLAALHFYQLAIPAPRPEDLPRQDRDKREDPNRADQIELGRELFAGKAQCATCHVPPLYTEPGWNMHTPEEIGIDSFQADRSPDRRYRTTPLKGMVAKTNGGFYHDGRFPTLLDVINHYDAHFNLGLSGEEKKMLTMFLKSL